MAYVYYNPNPSGKAVGDCVIRALSKVLGYEWEQTYVNLISEGYAQYDLPNSNDVWVPYLRDMGFEMHPIPNTCPRCYTVKDFCKDHPDGTHVVATGSHAVAVVDGDYYDAWDSGMEVPMYFLEKEV